jgi:hypothetical protein
MAERLVPLPATQVAWVRFPVPARPTISVEKLALFCNPAAGVGSLTCNRGRLLEKGAWKRCRALPFRVEKRGR